MAGTLIIKLTIDNQQYEIEIPRPTAKQRVCDLGEPLVMGIWGGLVPNEASTPEWEDNGTRTQ